MMHIRYVTLYISLRFHNYVLTLPPQSEYIAECDKRREFISGFSGSAGTAVVTLTEAYLWTDGRYHIQASQQLDDQWTLMKMGESSLHQLSKPLHGHEVTLCVESSS